MISRPDAQLTITTPSDHEVVLTRVVSAPQKLVFEAYTLPHHVQRWLLGPEGWTMPICEIDLREGGIWHYVWRKDDGTEMGMTGVYKEITPYERLVCTEAWGGDWPETLNTVVLIEENGKTRIEQWVQYPSKAARDAAIATGMRDGAEVSYSRLEEYLQTQL